MDYIVNGFKEADTPVEDHNKPWMVKLALRSVNNKTKSLKSLKRGELKLIR